MREIQAHGVTVNGCFVLGLDGATPAVFDDVLQFAEETNLFEVQVTLQTGFPGTPLLKRLEGEGRVLEPGRWDLCTLFDVNYQPLGMTVDELRAGIVALSERLYSREAMERRRRPFYENHRKLHRRKLELVPRPRSAPGSAAVQNETPWPTQKSRPEAGEVRDPF